MAPLPRRLYERLALNDRFGRLWIGVGTSNLADGMNVAAAPLLAATLTRDPLLVAGLSIAHRAPWVLFSIPAGAVADRFDRRRVLVLANLVRAAAVAGLGFALAGGGSHLALLYAAFFFVGVAETLFDNASFAILPSLVPRPDFARANGRLYVTTSLSNEFLGPPVGGVLFAGLIASPFLLGSGLYAASAALVLTMGGRYRPAAASPSGSTSLWAEMEEGVRWFLGHAVIRTLSLHAGTMNLVNGAAIAILVLFAQERLGVDEAGYGLLLAAGSAGGIAGGLSAGALAKKFAPASLILLTNLLAAASYAAIGISPNAPVVGLLLAFISFVVVAQNVVVVSMRQVLVPDALLARVTSVYRTVAMLGMPIGALLGGSIARHWGLGTPYLFGGAVVALVAFAILPVVNESRIDAARRAPAGEPQR